MASPTFPLAEPSPSGIGLSRDNEHSHVPMIKPEEIVSLHLHPQFQPLSLAYPLQDIDTVMVCPSPDVASKRSLVYLSEPPARLQDNYPIVSLSQHPEYQPMSLYPKDMVFHSSPFTVTIRGQSQDSHDAAYENRGQTVAELTHPKRPARKSAASRKPKKAKVFIPPQVSGRQKSKAVIDALNAASGGKNDRAAALAAEHMRGTYKGHSGKWVSCNTEA